MPASFSQGFKHGRWQLALRGPADPSGRGEAYSYTRLAPPEKGDKPLATAPPAGIAGSSFAAGASAAPLCVGTQSDLRKLKLKDCVAWLEPHGYTKAQVQYRYVYRCVCVCAYYINTCIRESSN